MKLTLRLCLAIAMFAFSLSASAQFRRSSDHKVFAFTNTLRSNDVFIIGRITPDTNYNYAVSNLWGLITNTAAYFSTNSGISAATATNIAAYQAFLATNGWTVVATNIAAYQAQIATNNYAPTVTQIINFKFSQAFAFNGSLVTNLNGEQVRYPTNQAIATAMDVGNKYTGFATNDNISIAGCANVDSSGTNISWGILTITNTAGSAAVKTIGIPAEWVDVDNLGSSTIYNTNQGVLSVMVYPNLGTNFIWRGK